MQGQQCSNCLFYSDGKCLRYPPFHAVQPDLSYQECELNNYPQFEWPRVRNIDWCGEWKSVETRPS